MAENEHPIALKRALERVIFGSSAGDFLALLWTFWVMPKQPDFVHFHVPCEIASQYVFNRELPAGDFSVPIFVHGRAVLLWTFSGLLGTFWAAL